MVARYGPCYLSVEEVRYIRLPSSTCCSAKQPWSTIGAPHATPMGMYAATLPAYATGAFSLSAAAPWGNSAVGVLPPSAPRMSFAPSVSTASECEISQRASSAARPPTEHVLILTWLGLGLG